MNGNDQEFDLEELLKKLDALFPEDGSEEPEGELDLAAVDAALEAAEPEELPHIVQPVIPEPEIAPDPNATRRFIPPQMPEESPEPQWTPAPETGPEPYSGEWQPRYEDPIGEYVPPPPILFKPRSRLRELKRKLVAGPEKRFYELSGQGVGKLQLAIFLSFAVVLLSAGAGLMYQMGMIPETRLKLMIFGQFFAMLLSALLGTYQLMEGIGDLFRLRLSLNSLLVITLGLCVADGIFCLQELRIPCCAAFSLQVTVALWGAYHRRVTELRQMDTLRKAVRLEGLVASADYHDGKPGILQTEGQVEDFMDTYKKRAFPEKMITWYAAAVLVMSLAAGILAGVLHGIGFGVQAAALTLLAAVPASFFVTLTRPAAILQKRLSDLGTVLCGWQGVEGLSADAVMPLDFGDLFPPGTVKMNGVKFYGTREPDEVVAYAAALMGANGGGMAELFDRLLDSRNGRHYDAEDLQIFDDGISGTVNGEAVLAGGVGFMRDMGVEVPEGIRTCQAVYTAIDGRICGVFAVTLETDRSSAEGMATLCAYKSLKGVLVCKDFLLTPGFLRGKFRIRKDRLEFPDPEVREALRSRGPEEGLPTLALTTREGLSGKAYAVTGARALKTAVKLGVGIHVLAGAVGMAMMLVLTALGSFELLTPVNMFLYELLWMVPGLLATEWTRVV